MKLHLGCGERYIPDWIHIDVCGGEHIDHNTFVHDLHMIEDESCEEIYASHVLEYYDWDAAQETVLPEWYRVLTTDGILRVAVPDFEIMSKLYVGGLRLDMFVGPLYGKIHFENGIPGLPLPQTIYHKTVYDEEKLAEVLLKVGFRNPKRYDWHDTEHSNIDDFSQAYIPHMDKERGTLISLNMEARKT